MRLKLLFVLILCTLSYSMTELKFSKDTVKMGEEVTLTGKFTAPGDTVDVKVFLDRDADKVFTEGTDLLMFDSKEEKEPFIDGADYMDSLKDGLLNLSFIAGGDGPFPIAGSYVWKFDDKGTESTLSILILPLENPLYIVQGTISGPDGPIKDLMVWANLSNDMKREDSTKDEQNHITTISMSDGTYKLALPVEWKGQKIMVGTWDDFDVLLGKGYLPPPHAELLFDKDTLMHNFVFQKATQFIKLLVMDEENKAIPDLGINIWKETETGGDGESIWGETDINGIVLLPTKPGKWGVGVENYDSEDKKFMTPHIKLDITETTDTLVDTFKVYTTNGSIFVKVNNTVTTVDPRSFGFNISVKPEGSDVELYSYYNYEGETEFQLAATTLLTNYQFHHWTKMDVGTVMISAVPNSGLKVGDTVMVTIKEKEIDKVIKGTVINEAGVPVAGVSLNLHEEMNQGDGIKVTTDEKGNFYASVYPGKWNIRYEYHSGMTANYLVPDMRVEVTDANDTVMVDYKVVTTDGFITVNLFNLSGLTIDEYHYGVEIYYEKEDGMRLKANPSKVDDTTWSYPVSSTFNTMYKLNSWLDQEKYPNIFISPGSMSGLKSTDVIRVEIGKPSQVLKVIVTDETNTPIPNYDILAWKLGEGHMEFEGKLDASGIGYIPILPGDWEIFVATEMFMNKHHKLTVTAGVDTTTYTYVLKKPDAEISGKLVNISKYKISDFDDIGVGAEAHPPLDSMKKDSTGEGPKDNYYMRVKIKDDGSFILPVLKTDAITLGGYFVSVEDWNLPNDVAIAPSSKGFMFYPYINVQPGNDSLYFAMFNVDGLLYGTVELAIMDSILNKYDKSREENPVGAIVKVTEKTTGFTNVAEIMSDGKYEMPLPKGDFKVEMEIYLPDTTIKQTIESLIMDGGNTEVRFTDDGIIITPIITDVQQTKYAFFAQTIDNVPVINFTLPEAADVNISLLDLRGRVLAERSLNNLTQGTYKAEFANQQLASGFYISRIQVLSKQGFVKYLKFIIK